MFAFAPHAFGISVGSWTVLSMVSKRRDCITKQIVAPWLVGLVLGSDSVLQAVCFVCELCVGVCAWRCVGGDVIGYAINLEESMLSCQILDKDLTPSLTDIDPSWATL